MKYYNIHFSPTGGTEKVASILTGAIAPAWQEVDLCRETAPTELCADDVCLVSVPSYGGRVPGIALERLGAFKGNGARAVLVCVYGNRAWDDTLTELQDTLESCGFLCVAAVAAVAEHSVFRQFAAGRPDAADAAELAEFAEKIKRKLSSSATEVPVLAGGHGTYKPYGGIPFKPEGSGKCTGCGLCAAACPVGAIDPADPRKTDKDKCISCMRCIGLCPRHARDLNALVMKGAAVAMASKLGGRKENHVFL